MGPDQEQLLVLAPHNQQQDRMLSLHKPTVRQTKRWQFNHSTQNDEMLKGKVRKEQDRTWQEDEMHDLQHWRAAPETCVSWFGETLGHAWLALGKQWKQTPGSASGGEDWCDLAHGPSPSSTAFTDSLLLRAGRDVTFCFRATQWKTTNRSDVYDYKTIENNCNILKSL